MSSLVESKKSPSSPFAFDSARVWRFSDLFRGLNIVIGLCACGAYVSQGTVLLDIILLQVSTASFFLCLFTAVFILSVEFSGIARAPKWLRAVFACLLGLNAIPMVLFELPPFNPCFGNHSPYSKAQLDFLESCSELGSLYINNSTVAEENMNFKAFSADGLSFSNNSVVKTISFPNLQLRNSFEISISGNDNLETILLTGPIGMQTYDNPPLLTFPIILLCYS